MNCTEKTDKIKEELADVMNYCVLMADACGLDIDEIVQDKMKRNHEKYPVELVSNLGDFRNNILPTSIF